jgi:hypothetical protein
LHYFYIFRHGKFISQGLTVTPHRPVMASDYTDPLIGKVSLLIATGVSFPVLISKLLS